MSGGLTPCRQLRPSSRREHVRASNSGWMTSTLFMDFLGLLDSIITRMAIPRPVLLLVDGHASHVRLNATKFCTEKNNYTGQLHGMHSGGGSPFSKNS